YGLLMVRTTLNAARRPRARQGLRRAFPALALLTASWSIGETFGYWFPNQESTTHIARDTAHSFRTDDVSADVSSHVARGRR
ncbi:MAG: hypothetical protein ACRD1H_10705, partial [Vicinamibacterales bacterium]